MTLPACPCSGTVSPARPQRQCHGTAVGGRQGQAGQAGRRGAAGCGHASLELLRRALRGTSMLASRGSSPKAYQRAVLGHGHRPSRSSFSSTRCSSGNHISKSLHKLQEGNKLSEEGAAALGATRTAGTLLARSGEAHDEGASHDTGLRRSSRVPPVCSVPTTDALYAFFARPGTLSSNETSPARCAAFSSAVRQLCHWRHHGEEVLTSLFSSNTSNSRRWLVGFT